LFSFYVFTDLCFYLFLYFELQAQTGRLRMAFFSFFFVFHETGRSTIANSIWFDLVFPRGAFILHGLFRFISSDSE